MNAALHAYLDCHCCSQHMSCIHTYKRERQQDNNAVDKYYIDPFDYYPQHNRHAMHQIEHPPARIFPSLRVPHKSASVKKMVGKGGGDGSRLKYPPQIRLALSTKLLPTYLTFLYTHSLARDSASLP